MRQRGVELIVSELQCTPGASIDSPGAGMRAISALCRHMGRSRCRCWRIIRRITGTCCSSCCASTGLRGLAGTLPQDSPSCQCTGYLFRPLLTGIGVQNCWRGPNQTKLRWIEAGQIGFRRFALSTLFRHKVLLSCVSDACAPDNLLQC